MKLLLPYTPTEKQLLFHNAREDEVLYGGAAGGGKSTAVVMDAFLRCYRHPGSYAYLFRRTYRELEDTLIAEALRRIPSALGSYQASAHGLRASKALGIRPLVRATSNPGGPGHAWVKARFVDPVAPGQTQRIEVCEGELRGERSLRYIPARVQDNPHIGQDYLLELAQKPRALREALLYGRWDAFEGQVFTAWRDDPAGYRSQRFTHVVEPFEIPESWRRPLPLPGVVRLHRRAQRGAAPDPGPHRPGHPGGGGPARKGPKGDGLCGPLHLGRLQGREHRPADAAGGRELSARGKRPAPRADAGAQPAALR